MQTESPEAPLTPVADLRNFNSSERFVEGWYWAIPSRELPVGAVRPVKLLGRDLAVFRSETGKVTAMDAHCPHMGAHLAEGRVEGEGLRCFFHHWKFEADGHCSDVPSLGRPVKACVRTWPTEEKYGMVWVWTGEAPDKPIPYEPELRDFDCDASFGRPWVKNCHPNVVMINAIDAHHFNSVHNLPAKIVFETATIEHQGITFANTTRGGEDSWFVRLIRPLYKEAVTYKLCYWWGSTGTVTVGPDAFHFHIMFTSRMLPGGQAEGRTILLTKRRPGILGWLFNRVVLFLTRLVGDYFAKGDTQVFQTMKFDLKTPVGPDRSVLDFVHHLEKMPAREFGTWQPVAARLEALPDPARVGIAAEASEAAA